MKKHLPTILVAAMLIFGLALLFYPDFSTWYNSRIHAGIVDDYTREVIEMPRERIYDHFRRADEHNAELAQLGAGFPFVVGHMATALLPEDYLDILRVGGVMGHVEIPKINVNLPIYHTTHTSALNRGAGHLEGTSFPVGGYSTHSAITAHSALPNARMFTDIEGNIEIGDQFFIQVLDRRLAYEVFYIRTVLPHEIESLRIVPGEDLMTLITCTPYAINTHRLLVHGRRIPYIQYMAEEIAVVITATSVDIRVYIFLGFFMLFILVFFVYQVIVGKHGYVRKGSGLQHPAFPGHGSPVAPRAGPIMDYSTPAPAYPSSRQADPYINPNEYYAPAKATPAPRPLYESHTRTNPVAGSRNPRFNSHLNIRRNIALACISVLVLVLGIGFVARMQGPPRPNAQSAVDGFVTRIENYRAAHRERLVADLIEQIQEGDERNTAGDFDNAPLTWLHQLITEHNRQIYESGQTVQDPFTYSQDSFNLSYFGFDEEMIGFITIPRVDIELPVYMGTNRENLNRGLAHVTYTSLPIGGAGTNAVIAGDLGRLAMLRDIDQLEIGDVIEMTNFYETITYSIIDIRHIYPTQTDALTVQSGRDLISLLAYRPGYSQRYLVLAERVS